MATKFRPIHIYKNRPPVSQKHQLFFCTSKIVCLQFVADYWNTPDDASREEFEKNEQKKFGKDGFETMVGKVADIEKELGIYELAQFTQKV